MASVEERLVKLREDRVAREKARIEKLRELNLKKYSRNDILPTKNSSTVSIPNKVKSEASLPKGATNSVKNNVQANNVNRRLTSAPIYKNIPNKNVNHAKNIQNNINGNKKVPNHVTNIKKNKVNLPPKNEIKQSKQVKNNIDDKIDGILKDITAEVNKGLKLDDSELPKVVVTQTDSQEEKKVVNKSNVRNDLKSRKSLAFLPKTDAKTKFIDKRKSMIPNLKSNKESVFDRLYKPKIVQKESIDNALKLKTDPSYLKKVINDSRLIMNKRHTTFETKPTLPVRRSISAVHFKRISRSELANCVHKWASIGEKINKVHLKDVNEDDCVRDEKVVSAVKSERKKVKFQTPIHLNFNTPKPEEMQSKLQKWLQKRGKSIDSYHHLQCFGIHHLSKDIRPLNAPNFEDFEEENKENVALDHDSDNDSFLDNMNNKNDINRDGFQSDKWRRVSSVSDSVCNDSYESTLTSGEVNYVDELLLGALHDLTELLKEGFDWEQSARWLRAIRDKFPSAPESAPYWECRAALEERRGDLPASVSCWEQAIAKGTEHSVVEANLDQLLDKFMQLKISPNTGRKQVDPKLVDVKNVFKSTIIRFAVQQAKLRQSTDAPKYMVTPVRRSSRLSSHWRNTPRVCTTIQQANEIGAEFIPNKAMINSP